MKSLLRSLRHLLFAFAALTATAAGFAQLTFDPANPPSSAAPPTEQYNAYTGTFSQQKGPKTVLVILVQPSDGATWSNPPSFATLDGQLTASSQSYYNASYHQTWFGPKRSGGFDVPRLVVTPVLVLPKTAAVYLDQFGTLQSDCLAAVRAQGGDWNGGVRDPNNYDRWVVMSNTKLINSTGLAYVGGRFSWVGTSLSGGVTEHEWGHNWGVVHANSWDVPAGSHPRASAGSSGEYNDGWDVMGGNNGTVSFNPQFRIDLGFLENSRSESLHVSASGTYRLYDYVHPYRRQDAGLARALVIPMNNSFTGYQRVVLGFGHHSGTDGGTTRTDWNRNAVTVHSDLSDGSNRIDTTPGSRQTGDADDSSIKIGRTYSEGASVNGTQQFGGFHVTPVARGSTTFGGVAHEWIDVVVNYQNDISGNVAPSASFAQTIYSVAPGSPLALAVNASDANGNTLAYDWDFGDGSYSISNSSSQTKTWSAAGFYRVACTVSDMRGGVATASCWVNVGSLALRSADAPVSTIPGLAYRYFESGFSAMPVFANLLPKKAGTVPAFEISNRDRNDNFAYHFDGYLDVPADDIYTFRVTSDDGGRLYIGDTLVVNNAAVQSSAYWVEGNIGLRAGKHRVRLEYFHKDGSESLSVAWRTLGTALTPLPASALSQVDPAGNAAPSVAISLPLENASFVVNSDVLIQAEASDADGISSVVFFANGSYLGSDSAAPYTYTWPKVPVGSHTLEVVAYDLAGRWSRSAPVGVQVVSPEPQPSIGFNLNPENVSGGNMFLNDVSGAVYPQANWNNLTGLTGSRTTVSDYLGNTIPVSVSWTSTANNNFGDGASDADTSTGPGRMFKGLAEIRQEETVRPSLTAGGVPYAQYDVYVYFDLRASDVKDTLPQRFVLTPAEGAAPPDLFGKNSLLSNDSVGDYPNYDTWVGFREATATSATASNDLLLGNYVVFRGIRASGFTVRAERQIAATQQRLGINAVQIVRSEPTAPVIVLSQTGGATAVAEGGATDSYSLVLGYAPTSDVTVQVSAGAQLAASPGALTFTPANWNVPQIVSLSAVDDASVEGAQNVTVTHSVSSSGDYAGLAAPSVAVAITDNDQTTVTVGANGVAIEGASPTGAAFQIARGGASSLASALTVGFQMGGTASFSGDYTLSGASVAYDAATGAGTVVIPAGQAQVFVVLTPVNDATAEGIENVSLTLTAGASYSVGSPASASRVIRDDDATDYFTQLFTTATWDLNGVSLTFTPSGGSYTATGATVTAFPSGTSSFTSFNEAAMTAGTSDDGYWSYTLPAAFTYFGTSYTTAYVSTNGHVSFGGTSWNDSGNSASSHFTSGRPRVSVIASDLDPGAGGTVNYRRVTGTDARTIIYYNAVRNYSDSNAVSAQLELFDDGRIRITWLSSTPFGSQCVGLSSGASASMPSSPFTASASPRPFFESDLSSYLVATNQLPQFASVPVLRAVVGSPYAYGVAATDVDGQTLTLTAPTRPAWLGLVTGPNGSATLSGTPTAAGTFPVTLQASDGVATAQQNFSLIVVPAAGNTPPAFTSTPPVLVSSGQNYSYAITTADADGHARSLSATELPGWLTLTDHGNGTATLTGVAPDTGVRSHSVTLVVSDAIVTVAQSFVITLNRPPVVTLSSPASGQTVLGSRSTSLLLDAVATDDGLPASSTITAAWTQIAGPSGSAGFASPGALRCAVSFASAGWHTLRLAVSDGAASTVRDVQVFVETDGEAVALNGLQGWWRFDEGSGATASDSSGNARDLVLTGATMSADGVSGKAYTADASITQVAANDTLAAPAQLTFAAWVYAGALPATNDRNLFVFHSSGTNRLRLYLANGTNRLRFYSDRSTDGLWEADYRVPGQEWFHLVVSYDSSSAAADPVFYVNGRAVSVTEIGAAPAGAQVASAGFRLGGNSANSQSWNGRIDEARLYNRIVPAAELSLLARWTPINLAPLVSAGPDADTPTGSAYVLGGSVSDANPAQTPVLVWSLVSGPGVVNFGTESAANSTVTLSVAGPHVLRLGATDGDVSVFDEMTLTGVAQPVGFASWINAQAGVGEATGDGDDPDGDRIPNLLEYALGGQPGVRDTGLLPAAEAVTEGGQTRLVLDIAKNPEARGLTYIVEVSGNLSTWSSGAGHVTILEETDSTLVVRDDTPLSPSAPRRFIRLRVER